MQENGAFTPGPANTALIHMVVQANKWWGMLAGGEIDVRTLARREGVNEAYLTRVMRAAFLSPHVTEAILAGRQNAEVTAAGLRDPGSIPIDWHEQARTFLPAAVGAVAR